MILIEEAKQQDTLNLSQFNFYLTEVRKNLIFIIIFFLIVFIGLAPFSKKIYSFLAEPLQKILPANAHMIATDITSTFVAPFKLVFFVTVLLLIPFIFFRICAFLKTALYVQEKQAIFLFCFISTLLFYSGVLLGYLFILPTVLHFFVSIAPDSVVPMTDINQYLIFCMKFFMVLGLVFQLPLLIVILIYFNIISLEVLENKRAYAIVISFFIAMFITPPDIFSMAIAGCFIYLLYEIGVGFSKLVMHFKSKRYDKK